MCTGPRYRGRTDRACYAAANPPRDAAGAALVSCTADKGSATSSSGLRSASIARNQATTPPTIMMAPPMAKPQLERGAVGMRVVRPADQVAEDRRRRRPADALRDREEVRDGLTPQLEREDLAHGQVGRRRSGRRDEEDDTPDRSLRRRIQHFGLEQERRDQQQHAGRAVGERDHLAPADRVEEMAEQQWPEQVADREGEEVVAGRALGDTVEVLQDERIGKEDRVVEEGLSSHHGEAENRPAGIFAEEDLRYLDIADVVILLHLERLVGWHVVELHALIAHALLDLVHDALGLVVASVRHQPAWAFRDCAPEPDDD